jgi:8-oxo-dGTP pyrophosphatase MutT (NUDIX family)
MIEKKCVGGCCSIFSTEYNAENDEKSWVVGNAKAGALLFDEAKNAVLLVQSRGNLWGISKGSLESGETPVDGAIREVREETGIDISTCDFSESVVIYNLSTYFFIKHSTCAVSVQDEIRGNDVTAVAWLRLSCLKTLITNQDIKLTKHAKIVLRKYLNFT